MEDGQGQETGRLSRGSSFRKSVSGLVRRVSQRVTRENKGMRTIRDTYLVRGRGRASKKDYFVDKNFSIAL